MISIEFSHLGWSNDNAAHRREAINLYNYQQVNLSSERSATHDMIRQSSQELAKPFSWISIITKEPAPFMINSR
jgi:hypothetical protein